MKTKEEYYHVLDRESKIWSFPPFIRKWFLKTYYSQGLIQMDSKTRELTVCGDVVRWLDKISVTTTNQKRADRLMFEFLNKKYPQYKSYIQLF